MTKDNILDASDRLFKKAMQGFPQIQMFSTDQIEFNILKLKDKNNDIVYSMSMFIFVKMDGKKNEGIELVSGQISSSFEEAMDRLFMLINSGFCDGAMNICPIITCHDMIKEETKEVDISEFLEQLGFISEDDEEDK